MDPVGVSPLQDDVEKDSLEIYGSRLLPYTSLRG